MSANSSPLSSALSSPIDVGSPSSFLKLDSPSPESSIRSVSEPPEVTMTPEKKRRSPSPPHEEVLADNPDIAFIVMFRARFSDAFPQKLMNFGPQDIENGIIDSIPSTQVQDLLCALLGLVLNRKKPVERGHHNRALEDAVSSQKAEWPGAWNGVNPISGTKSFNTMTPSERLTLLRALIMWSLHSSEAISNIIKESYKQNRQEDDSNQPLSVQPWGRDGEKRRYWLVEGRDDTPFRLYRESNPALKTNNTWWSVAGTIEELQVVAEKLEKEGSQHAKRLSQRITAALPRFEATEEKRKRREYRLSRKAQFTRPEPGFSMYEGRTRGKRMKYTYSDNEDGYDDSDADGPDVRRSSRGAAVPSGAMTTSSGRQVRTRFGNMYGSTGENTARESPATDGFERSDGSVEPNNDGSRPTRSRGTLDGWANGATNDDEDMDEDSDAPSSGEEWHGEDELEERPDDEGDDMSDVTDEGLEPRSLVVKLQYKKPSVERINQGPTTPSREKQPNLAYREGPTPTSTHTSRPLDPSSLVNNGSLLPVSSLTSSNGFSYNGTAPNHSSNFSVREEPEKVTLPSFSKFIYNPLPAVQTSSTSPIAQAVQPPSAYQNPNTIENPTPVQTSNHQNPSSLPTPPTTVQQPINHNRPW